MNKPIHFVGIYKTITPCGIHYYDSNIFTQDLKEVTCKKCLITNWVKEIKRKDQNARIL